MRFPSDCVTTWLVLRPRPNWVLLVGSLRGFASGSRSTAPRPGGQSRERDRRPWGLGSAASINPETTTEAASSATEPLLKNRSNRRALAASDGVSGAGLLPERTGVKPSGDRLATVAPSTAEATVFTTAPPSSTSLARVSPGALSSASSLTPPSLHPRTVERAAGRFTAWKRAHASFRTRPRSLLSEMVLTVGLSATCPKSVPPDQADMPGLWATLPSLEGPFIVRPFVRFIRSRSSPASRGCHLLIRRGRPANRTSASSARRNV